MTAAMRHSPLPVLTAVAALAGVPAPAADIGCSVTDKGLRRTCIDGGGGALITLRPDRPVGVAIAMGRAGQGNARQWNRRLLGQPSDPSAQSLIFGKPCSTDLDECSAFLSEPLLNHDPSRSLLGYAAPYMATRSEPEDGGRWISYVLAPRHDMRTTLAGMGLNTYWHPLAEHLTQLLGRTTGPKLRPWSIAFSLDTGAVRLGTTAWARQPETPQKAMCFASHMGCFATDTQAAGIYSLLTRRAAAQSSRFRVGVAVEYTFDPDGTVRPMFTLRTPPDSISISDISTFKERT